MNEEELETLKKELYRYKTLYEIVIEENQLLKEKCTNLENTIYTFERERQQELPKKSFIYKGLRKIYHVVKR